MNTWGRLLQTMVMTFALSGCGYAMEEMGLFKTGEIILKTPLANTFSEATIDFYVVNNTALKTCLDCHRTKAPILDTEDKVYEHREDIMATVELGEMPPVRKGYKVLTACELEILRAYFDNKTNNRVPQRVKELPSCGSGTPVPPAPGPSPEPTVSPTPPTPPTPPGPPGPPKPPGPPGPPGPPPPPPPGGPAPTPTPTPSPLPQPDLGQLELSFKNLRMAFFDAKCLNCHSELAKKPKDPLLDSVAHIRGAKDAFDKSIVGSTGAESLLYKITVPGLADSIMPPARYNMQLSTAEADYLKRWIDAGMPE